MELIIKEERTSFNIKKNESIDSQNIIGSIKEIQNKLEDEEEYNKEEIIEVFNEISQIKPKKKTVSFASEKNLVTIIKVESYKKYNSPIEIGTNMNKRNKNKNNNNTKRKKDLTFMHENDLDYLDLHGNSGNSCFIF